MFQSYGNKTVSKVLVEIFEKYKDHRFFFYSQNTQRRGTGMTKGKMFCFKELFI